MMNKKDVEKILPHRSPMLLVDRVSTLKFGESLIAHFIIPSPVFTNKVYPKPLIIESLCQAAGILFCKSLKEGLGDRLMLFGSINSFTFYKEARVGDELTHQVRIEKSLGDTAIMSGKVLVGENIIERLFLSASQMGNRDLLNSSTKEKYQKMTQMSRQNYYSNSRQIT